MVSRFVVRTIGGTRLFSVFAENLAEAHARAEAELEKPARRGIGRFVYRLGGFVVEPDEEGTM